VRGERERNNIPAQPDRGVWYMDEDNIRKDESESESESEIYERLRSTVTVRRINAKRTGEDGRVRLQAATGR
jgi:hypothetical protein